MSGVRRLVVKVGTNVLSDKAGRLDREQVANVCQQVHELKGRGLEVIVVSSGAIGAGMGELNMKSRPKTLPELQAAAAVGQSHLIRAYDEIFRTHGYRAAQVLLTREDVNDRTRYLNGRNALLAMLELGAVPVINENDTTSVDEITFGDNDYLAAMVTNLLRAELLVLLTVVDGLEDDSGRVIDTIEADDASAVRFARSERTTLGKGGMASKLEAAEIARSSGEMVMIANGRRKDVLLDLLDGRTLGTLLLPSEKKLSSRRRWIGFGARPRGTLRVDDGARRALLRRGKSLLPSGVVSVDGTFRKGDIVNVADASGRVIARGLANYASDAASTIAGHKSAEIPGLLGSCPYVEIVHRDNLVILEAERE
jgi:glutamate 5-kinase